MDASDPSVSLVKAFSIRAEVSSYFYSGSKIVCSGRTLLILGSSTLIGSCYSIVDPLGTL